MLNTEQLFGNTKHIIDEFLKQVLLDAFWSVSVIIVTYMKHLDIARYSHIQNYD